MAKLTWNDFGNRLFETGVDRGVLYTVDGSGIPWNGLTAVNENPTGAEATGFYLDGEKYLNRLSPEDFGGTIEAFTFPDAFSIHDGTQLIGNGLSVNQQRRKPFAFSYRTKIGNDADGVDHGYKIHIVYNALAKPTAKPHSSLSESVSPTVFSWEFTTTPVRPVSDTPLAPLSHIAIDSTKTSLTTMYLVEEWLYGSSENVAGSSASLLPLDTVINWFEHPLSIMFIMPDVNTGLAQLVEEVYTGDFIGDIERGLYTARYTNRLIETIIPGLFTFTGVIPSSDIVHDIVGEIV